MKKTRRKGMSKKSFKDKAEAFFDSWYFQVIKKVIAGIWNAFIGLLKLILRQFVDDPRKGERPYRQWREYGKRR